MSKLNYTILCVDDEVLARKSLEHILSEKYEKIYFAENGVVGFELYQKHKPSLIITDIKMPIMDGIQFIHAVREIDVLTPIIIVSSFEKEFLKLSKMNISEFILKPVSRFNLISKIQNVIS